MTSPDPTPRQARGESMLAFSIMFFSGALLCFLLGWADGVRHDKTYLHIPETGSLARRDRDPGRARRCLSRLVARHEAWLTISGRGFARCAILFQPGDIAPEYPEFPPRSDRLGGRPQPCRMGFLYSRLHSGKGCARSGVRPHLVWDRFSDLRGAELSWDRSETRTRRAEAAAPRALPHRARRNPWTLRQVQAAVPRVCYAACRISDLPAGDRFDVIFMHNVTEHLMAIEEVLPGYGNGLRPGGKIIYRHHNYACWNGHHQKPRTTAEIDPADPAAQSPYLDWAHLEFEPARHPLVAAAEPHSTA